ncbi:MAG: KpsF/GutQ family sugar-phosphate isomerase [Alphaproteobacteria bacterium]|nr:KpsF/GutQ family sugar-phosphate isomerase [Alphaproteobacteria bacterium]
MNKTTAKMKPMDDSSILQASAEVLTEEGEALKELGRSLNGHFVKAVETMMACKGRVIVTGMGKSGHVGRKIAATLASTGTPSYFVHPSEASHGDLGMIVNEDVVLALSNSGEVSEMVDLIQYTRRFSIPLIAMTSCADSTLASAADVSLILPRMREVCPMGLAPTTSTTMMMALGDALAVSIMSLRGFTAEDFHNFHPGGKLGKKLMRVRDLMHKGDEVPLVSEEEAMSQVLLVMTQKSLGCAGIVDASGNLVGIITDGDLRRHMNKDLTSHKACEIMTKSPMTVGPNALAAEVIKLINDNKRTQVFIVENGKPIGILHIHDLLRAGIA